MQRAAAGLASAVLDLLGRAYGARVVLLVGSGDNGGDALYAGAMLARRGVPGERVAAVRQAARGRARRADPGRRSHRHRGAARGAGPRRRRHRRHRRTAGARAEAEAALEALAGRAGRRGRRTRAASTSTPASSAGAAVRADVTVTFGTHKVALLADPGGVATPGVVHLGRHRRSTSPTRPSRASRPTTWPRCCRGPTEHAHKYTRGVVGVRAGSVTYPGAGVLCVAGAASGLCGMVRYVAGARDEVVAAHPDVVTAERPGPGVDHRLGRRARRRDDAGRGAARRRPDRRRRRRAEPGGRPADRARRAHPARRRAVADDRVDPARRSRPRRCATPARPPPGTTPWCCSRAGARWSPGPTAGPGSPPPGSRGWPRPERATCSPG